MTDAPEPTRIHIDTDPGLDDLLALALAFASPELDVTGVTTVAGNASLESVTDNAQRFLALAGSEIPLGRGAAKPRALEPCDATNYHGVDGRAGISIPALDRRPIPDAQQVLRTSLVDRCAEIVLALGPLTNIAAALDAEPELFAHTELVWMGGTLSAGNVTGAAEFNAYSDPAAVERVLDAGLRLRIVGLDVTRDTHLVASQLPRNQFGDTSMSRLLWNILSAQMQAEEPVHGAPRATLHDPCALLACLPMDLFRWETKALEIFVGEGDQRGRLQEQGSNQALYASEVHGERVLGLFLERLERYASSRPA